MSLQSLINSGDFLLMTNGMGDNNSSLTFSSNKSLKVIHNISKDSDILITIKKGVSAKLFDIFNEVTSNVNVHITLEEASELEYTSLRQSDSNINYNVYVSLEKGANLIARSVSLFKGQVHFINDIKMNGDTSSAESMDVVINASSKKQTFDYETLHLGNMSTSTMRNFVINKNSSITFMNTNGIIKKYTKGVVISQKTKGILLDEMSEISANPVLTIDEYDCNASHGASIGAIDEEELYYLMSRGLTKEESEKLIIGGFVSPFLSSLNDSKLQEEVKKIIDKVL